MSEQSKWEYFQAIYSRYHKTDKQEKQRIIDEFCRVCGYHRKYAIRKLNSPIAEDKSKQRRRQRPFKYTPALLPILQKIWEVAGYPWSVRLKAILPVWIPWIRKHFSLTSPLEKQLLSISARQIDRRLKSKKIHLKRKLYGRTKPGTLLKHHIPIKTDSWNVFLPGFTEIDLVSHSGNSAQGEFAHTVNQTDILTTWVESRAVLGKSEKAVSLAMNDMEHSFPFKILGIDSDNGSEFINYHLFRRCQQRSIQFTRGRPYKKDDNAHIEQKNWTHVRKLLGWDRYDSQIAVDAINDLYRNELSLFQNLFLPSVKLKEKIHIGSKLTRIYDLAQTPFQRLIAGKKGDPQKISQLQKLKDRLDPFDLAKSIEKKLDYIYDLANHRQSPHGMDQTKTPSSNSLKNRKTFCTQTLNKKETISHDPRVTSYMSR